MHRPLRDVLRAGYVHPTDSILVSTKHIPFLKPETEGFNLLHNENGRTIRDETFARVRGTMQDGAHLPLFKTTTTEKLQEDIGTRTPNEFHFDEMKRFHDWIETQKKWLLRQLDAWPDQIKAYNRLSLCTVHKIPPGVLFSPYEIDEPLPMLTRGITGAWDQWTENHDSAMAVWFEVWKFLVSSDNVDRALVFDKA